MLSSMAVAQPLPAQRRQSPTVRFAAAGVLALAAAVVVYWLFVGTAAGQRLENEALLASALRDETAFRASLERLSVISVASFAAALTLMIVVGAARNRLGLGLVVAASMALAVVAAEVLKEILPRPELVSGPSWILRNSFPSGHTAVAAAAAVGALLVAPDRIRWLVLPAAAGIAALAGQATQVTGWHRMSCALGAVLIVVGVAALGLTVVAKAGLVQPDVHGRINRRLTWALIVAGGLAIVAGILVFILGLVFPILRAPQGAQGAFSQTTLVALGIGLTVLIITAFGVLIEPYTLGRSAMPAGRGSGAVPEHPPGGVVGESSQADKAWAPTTSVERRGRR